MEDSDEDDEEREFEEDDEEEDENIEAKNRLRFLEMEFANNVGFNASIKTCFSDFLIGKIIGVRSGGIVLTDKKKNRMFVDIDYIAAFCIFNKHKKAIKKKHKKIVKQKVSKKRAMRNK